MNYFVRLFLVTLLSYSECYKILVVYPFPARSHNILGNGFVKRLLTAGHEVSNLMLLFFIVEEIKTFSAGANASSYACQDFYLNYVSGDIYYSVSTEDTT